LIGLPRSTWYYEPRGDTAENLEFMRLLDEQYTRTPFYGSRRMTEWLRRQGHEVNRKRVGRLMRKMALEVIYPKPRLSQVNPEHRIYPYLLRGVPIISPDHVWSTDITYIRMRGGFLYLVAIIDWYSRYVLAWELSNSLDVTFCLVALERALRYGRPTVFNTDQGSQFTSDDFTGALLAAGIQISMDGRGRAIDNIYIERLWRTVKYEEVYLKDYDSGHVAVQNLAAFFRFYNTERPHQALRYNTPQAIYHEPGILQAGL
jgi:putative transposase